MRIAITGAGGLIGSFLTGALVKDHHTVLEITRQAAASRHTGTVPIFWDPANQRLNGVELEGLDAVVHLAGASVAQRWSPSHKRDILNSRVQGTRLLCATLSQLKQKPKVLLSASAVGFYGSHGADTALDESSPPGEGFLAQVCRQWEQETKTAEEAGIRVVHMRFGVVLDRRGGALAKMLLPFQLGLGGRLGSGGQMMSWIALQEIPPIISHLMAHEEIRGPVNVASPEAVSNREFTQALGQALHRPAVLPVPALAIKLLMGEMGQVMLLEGSRVYPSRLLETHYHFQWPNLQSALQTALQNS